MSLVRRRGGWRLGRMVDIDELRVSTFAAVEGRVDQALKQWCRTIRTALELWVCLRSDPERMLWQLDELDQLAVG